jgi:hypothetical protein
MAHLPDLIRSTSCADSFRKVINKDTADRKLPLLYIYILQVSFGMELDVYDFCAPELKSQLDGPRAALKEHQDRLIEDRKKSGAANNNKPQVNGC